MRKEEITAYFCDHCNKLYKRKHAAIKHEQDCSKNPDNFRPCLDCVHCEQKNVGVFIEGMGAYCTQKANVIFCTKLEKGLVRPQRQRTGFWYDLEDYENEPMPLECEFKANELETPFI